MDVRQDIPYCSYGTLIFVSGYFKAQSNEDAGEAGVKDTSGDQMP